MAVSEAQMRANHKYDKKAYFRPTLRIPRKYEDVLNEKAKEHGSMNGYILELIKKDLGEEG